MKHNIQYERALGHLIPGDAAELEKFRAWLRDSEAMPHDEFMVKHAEYMGFPAPPTNHLKGKQA